MNAGRIVFSQLMDYLPTYEFQKCVNRYSGDYRWVRVFWKTFESVTFQ